MCTAEHYLQQADVALAEDRLADAVLLEGVAAALQVDPIARLCLEQDTERRRMAYINPAGSAYGTLNTASLLEGSKWMR